MNSILDYQVVALIPARGGSKGLPRKNLLKVGGESLLERAIKCGTRCVHVNEVVVSTEDEEIAEVALSLGVEVHRRPASAAMDTSTAEDVVLDFAQMLESKNLAASTVLVYLQPTSPLRTSDHVSAAIELMVHRQVWKCVSVVSDSQSPFKSLRIDESGRLRPLFGPSVLTANRQILPRTVRPNGAIYIFRVHDFIEGMRIPIPDSIAYEMDLPSSIDVDSQWDLELANYVCSRN